MSFPEIRFNGQLRPSQAEVVTIARKKLNDGKRRLHIVAPPGSGKTVLGLFLWAECISVPAVVLSPNSAIQAQWAARTDLFQFPDSNRMAENATDPRISTNPMQPGLLTSLTYQSVTMPSRSNEALDDQARAMWLEKLVNDQEAENELDAQIWIDDLEEKNPDYFEDRIAAYRKKIRDQVTLGEDPLQILHRSSLATLDRLKNAGVQLIILDECHHLMGHWGRILSSARDMFDNPIVVGLTATPPDRDGKDPLDIERYDEFFGNADFEVPVPAVVKDGFLAPYQDLAYFVRPTANELEFVANTDRELDELVRDLCQPKEDAEEQRLPESEQTTDSEPNPATLPTNDTSIANDSENELKQRMEGEPPRLPDQPAPAITRRASPLPEWLYEVLKTRKLSNTQWKDWHSFERREEQFANAARRFLQSRKLPLPKSVPPLESPDVTTANLLSAESPANLFEHLIPVLDRYIRFALRRSNSPIDHQTAIQATNRLRMLGVQVTDTGTRACASPVSRILAYSRNKISALPEILGQEFRTLGDSIRAVVVTDFEKSSATTAEVEGILDRESGGAVAAFRELVATDEGDRLDPILLTGSSVLVDDDVVNKFMDSASKWLRQNGFQVELEHEAKTGFNIIRGKGNDWCPRTYVELITELFQQGVTRCLVGTRGLLGEGWDANRINVLIDLTTVTTSMTVNQLRGRSIRLDPLDPEKLANNWDVVCIAPEFTKGLDDYKRLIRKHQNLFGITDDGAIEKGIGHVHAALTEIKPEGLEGTTHVLNADMLKRVDHRNQVRKLWKIGKPYQSRPIQTVEAKVRLTSEGDFPPFAGRRTPWTNSGLTAAIAETILDSLIQIGEIKNPGKIHLRERDGGYLRLFLEQANETENRLFVDSLQEILSPIGMPRYIIPRVVMRRIETWLSRILPSIVAVSFKKRKKSAPCTIQCRPFSPKTKNGFPFSNTSGTPGSAPERRFIPCGEMGERSCKPQGRIGRNSSPISIARRFSSNGILPKLLHRTVVSRLNKPP